MDFAHDISEFYDNAASSHMKDLWQHFLVFYILAFQGYVVVAPDYAGLGIEKNLTKNTIDHEYLVNFNAANDLFYFIQTAQSAFSEFSKQFVIMRHFQKEKAV